jgi:hypothetical protein
VEASNSCAGSLIFGSFFFIVFCQSFFSRPFSLSFFGLAFYCLFCFCRIGFCFCRLSFSLFFFDIVFFMFLWLMWFHLYPTPTCLRLKGLVVVVVVVVVLYGYILTEYPVRIRALTEVSMFCSCMVGCVFFSLLRVFRVMKLFVCYSQHTALLQ